MGARKAAYKDVFTTHGIDLNDVSEDQSCGTCPFCQKEDHFYVNNVTGQWDCKHCLVDGNVYLFLSQLRDLLAAETTDRQYESLSAERYIPVYILKHYGLAYNYMTSEWVIPMYNDRGTVMDLRHWNGRTTMTTPRLLLHLMGNEELLKIREQTRVWVCEGEWDTMAMRWMLDEVGRHEELVVGVPGAPVFKDHWVDWFKGMDVILCYDNDHAGDIGAEKAGEKLNGIVSDLQYLCWPESLPEGYDLRDFIRDSNEKGMPFEEAFDSLVKMINPHHRHHAPEPSATPGAKKPTGPAMKFPEVVNTFKKWVKMDRDMERALAITLAICLSNEVPGDPLWLYLVAPPGGGKNLILMSLQESVRTVYRSSLTPASLISGFNAHPDPSLIPKLNGKTAIFKDGTELLSLGSDAKKEAYGILRGAYDGRITRSWGNGVSRDYKSHFNMIVGITPAIHADNQATQGERFLKFNMVQNQDEVQDKLRAAMGTITKEIEMEQELCAACASFLGKKIDLKKVRPIPVKYQELIITMAQLVSVLRAQVERTIFGGDRDILYRPEVEVGTRVVKQLAKLAQMLTFVFEVPEMNDEIFKIIRRVALDTCIGYHVDMVKAIGRFPTGAPPDTAADLAKMPRGMMRRKLEDLEQLGIVMRERTELSVITRGPAQFVWHLTPTLKRLWTTLFTSNGALPTAKITIPKRQG